MKIFPIFVVATLMVLAGCSPKETTNSVQSLPVSSSSDSPDQPSANSANEDKSLAEFSSQAANWETQYALTKPVLGANTFILSKESFDIVRAKQGRLWHQQELIEKQTGLRVASDPISYGHYRPESMKISDSGLFTATDRSDKEFAIKMNSSTADGVWQGYDLDHLNRPMNVVITCLPIADEKECNIHRQAVIEISVHGSEIQGVPQVESYYYGTSDLSLSIISYSSNPVEAYRQEARDKDKSYWEMHKSGRLTMVVPLAKGQGLRAITRIYIDRKIETIGSEDEPKSLLPETMAFVNVREFVPWRRYTNGITLHGTYYINHFISSPSNLMSVELRYKYPYENDAEVRMKAVPVRPLSPE